MKLMNYAETQNPDYFRTLIGRLIENEQRGDMSFIEKAMDVRHAKDLLQRDSGQRYYPPHQLAEALKQHGMDISPTYINTIYQCIDYLLPEIYELLYAGLEQAQIEQAIQLRNAGWSIVKQSDKRLTEDNLSYEFNTALAEREEAGHWDYESLKSTFATQLGLLLERPYSDIVMELDRFNPDEQPA